MSPSKAAQNSPRSSPSTKLRFPATSASAEDDAQSAAVSIPRFYHPPSSPTAEQMSEFSAAATAAFEAHGGAVTPSELRQILPSLCQCPGFLAHVRPLSPHISCVTLATVRAAVLPCARYTHRALCQSPRATCHVSQDAARQAGGIAAQRPARPAALLSRVTVSVPWSRSSQMSHTKLTFAW